MNKSAFAAALLAGVLVAAPALAQSKGPGGAYIGLGAMQTYTDNATDFAWSAIPFGGDADSKATGFKAYGGYVFPNRFGIEIGYYDLGTYDVRTFGVKSDEFNTTALAFSGTYGLPLNPKVDVLFKLGIAFTEAQYRCFSSCGWPFVDTKHSDIAGLMGIGVGWRVAPSFSVRADYEYFGAVTHAVGSMQGEYGYSAFSIAGQFHF
jgi:opacity protein-like surface antigen